MKRILCWFGIHKMVDVSGLDDGKGNSSDFFFDVRCERCGCQWEH